MSGFEIKSVTSTDGNVFFGELLGDCVAAVPTDDNGFFGKFERIDYNGLSVGFVRSRGRLALRRNPGHRERKVRRRSVLLPGGMRASAGNAAALS